MLLTVFILILAMFGILTYIACTLDVLDRHISELYKALEDISEAFGTDNDIPSSGGSEMKEKKLEAKFKIGNIVRHKALGQKFVIVGVHAPDTPGSFHSVYDATDPFHRYSVSPAMAPGMEQRIPEPALELITGEASNG